MRPLFAIAGTIRGLRAQMRLGKLSGDPVRLVSFALQGHNAECDWLTRPPQSADEFLPGHVRAQYASTQALCDAMTIREMLFGLLPEIRSVRIRAFRQSAREPPSLVIAGTVTRKKPPITRVTSPAMRAELYGFHFGLDSGVLVTLQAEGLGVSNSWQFNSQRPFEVEEAMVYGGK